MTSKEDEYREKIKVLDSKDRELKERERILEQRIKDEHDKMAQDKIKNLIRLSLQKTRYSS
ncbi:UNKNOWN [Stylonychia lemnae]|uniref:Uncharacterized protein n=1 Tax=Stylonychia lemnae TaxID=5949 RepID=A0A078B8K3_STYLE|nr:UNKNOWN [Stylonychia lemnae]|eukprot:CDW89627.1 UNKNOWN [Stylonychia lemnae]